MSILIYNIKQKSNQQIPASCLSSQCVQLWTIWWDRNYFCWLEIMTWLSCLKQTELTALLYLLLSLLFYCSVLPSADDWLKTKEKKELFFLLIAFRTDNQTAPVNVLEARKFSTRFVWRRETLFSINCEMRLAVDSGYSRWLIAQSKQDQWRKKKTIHWSAAAMTDWYMNIWDLKRKKFTRWIHIIEMAK